MSSSVNDAQAAWHRDGVLKDHPLVREWTATLGADGQAQAQWQIIDGGEWSWQSDGLFHLDHPFAWYGTDLFLLDRACLTVAGERQEKVGEKTYASRLHRHPRACRG